MTTHGIDVSQYQGVIDWVENIFFMYREIVRGNDERDTHYYITRGRVGAPGISLR